MKKIALFFLIVLQLNLMTAQEWCDSTFAVCDSIIIDSIWVTNHLQNGDRLQVRIQTDHEFLHGPYFIICPAADSIQFENNTFGWFGIAGPTTALMYYQFQEFNFTNETILGNLIVNNEANPFPHCIVPFSVTIGDSTTAIKNVLYNEGIEISPNPCSDFLTIKLENKNTQIDAIQLFDLMGKRYPTIFENDNLIDVRHLSSGMYLLRIFFENKRSATTKIIIE